MRLKHASGWVGWLHPLWPLWGCWTQKRPRHPLGCTCTQGLPVSHRPDASLDVTGEGAACMPPGAPASWWVVLTARGTLAQPLDPGRIDQ